jgi:hypothetical protein
MPEPNQILDSGEQGVASPTREIVGERLRKYYQFQCLRPTPARLRMLMEEFMRRGSDETSK